MDLGINEEKLEYTIVQSESIPNVQSKYLEVEVYKCRKVAWIEISTYNLGTGKNEMLAEIKAKLWTVIIYFFGLTNRKT